MSLTTTVPRKRTGWRLVGYLARRATMLEIRGYQSMFRFAFRRPRVPAGAVGFSYHQPVFAILIVFVVVSAMELVVVDLIVRSWPHIRIPLLILGIWGLVFMLGMLFRMLTRPHAVGPEGIRIRSGPEVDIALSWADIDSVAPRKHVVQEKQPKVIVDDSGKATLHLRMQNETNLEVKLGQPVTVRLPQGSETVSQVNLYADDPKAFVAEVRRHHESAT